MLIVDDGLTVAEFRADPEMRQTLHEFLHSPVGAQVLYILGEASQPVQVTVNFPQDKLQELHASAHQMGMGHRRAVKLLKDLAKPPSGPEDLKEKEPHKLGAKVPESELDKRFPKFELPAKTTPTT